MPPEASPTFSPARAPRVAIVGATGAVGEEFLRVLHQRAFPMTSLKLLASARSAGKTLAFGDQTLTVEALDAHSFDDVDLALFSAGGSISREFAPAAVKAGAVVVDNSSAFRMTDGVPLVVPEVNPAAIAEAGIGLRRGRKEDLKAGIIANPNCSTILMLMAVHPLHRFAGVERIVVSTYQAASGAGAAAMRELEQQTREALSSAGGTGEVTTKDVFGTQYAFNLFSHNSPVRKGGYNEEELKMVHETHKIWSQVGRQPDGGPDAGGGAMVNGIGGPLTRITATCIRVPVMRAHAESINLTFRDPITEQKASELLADAPGVTVQDDRGGNVFPTPLQASHQDDVFVGRVRRDLSQPEGRGLDLFVCGDQIRKGAALNAVQIAELLLERRTASR